MLVKSTPSAFRTRGFTLMEALVVLSIVAIVVAIGAPNLSFLIGTMNARSASFDLVADLALARSEAIKRNRPATVAPLVAGNWSQGWRITTTDPATGVAVTLRERGALPAALGFTSSAASLQFGANGRIGLDTAPANLSWEITSSNAGPRCVVITPTGSARSKMGAC
jgi:type IV fimbrial biogenesis protein FimT